MAAELSWVGGAHGPSRTRSAVEVTVHKIGACGLLLRRSPACHRPSEGSTGARWGSGPAH